MAQVEHRERLFYLIASLAMTAGLGIGFRMFYTEWTERRKGDVPGIP